MDASTSSAWSALAYLIAGVLFILALRGLSSPATSRAGNRYGMIGMTLAVATTLVTHGIASLPEIAAALALGGGIGFVIARRIQMTDMPQLVAAFHSGRAIMAMLFVVRRVSTCDANVRAGARALRSLPLV